jgi:hypothetical protein
MKIFYKIGEIIEKWRLRRHYQEKLENYAKKNTLSSKALMFVFYSQIDKGDTPKTAYVKAINKVRSAMNGQ